MRTTVLSALLAVACSQATEEPETTLHTLSMAQQLATQEMSAFPPESLPLDWNPTVWAFGVHRVYDATGDPLWRDYYRAWMDEALPDFQGDEPDAFNSSDSLSPSILAATLMLEDPSSDYQPILDAADAYLATAPRAANGAIAHWGEDNPWGMPSDQVWVDSLFMFGVYLVRQYQQTGDQTYLEIWWEQYEAFSDLCRDDFSQLYHHAYDMDSGNPIPDEAVYWARGNAWVLVSAAEALAAMGPDNGIWPHVEPLFQAHAEAIRLQQANDGLWHTVLNQPYGDDPANYTETSASALIAYAYVRGRESGVISGQSWLTSIQRTVSGILERVDEQVDGSLQVEGTSAGTNPGDYDDYLSVAQIDDLMLGYGATVMLLAEVDGLPGE